MKAIIKIVLAILIILCFIVAESCKKQKTKWEGSVEIESGVTFVKNPKEPIYGEIVLDLEEDLSIGRDDSDNYLFHRVRDIAVNSQRNIYVLDSGNFRIQKFDTNGQYLQTIGNKGQGPGEFESPSRIFLDSRDYIYVADGGGRRGNSSMIKVFNNQGEYVRNINLESPISDFHVDSEGNIFANVAQRVEGGNKMAFMIMDSEGKIIEIIAEFLDVGEVTKKSSEMTASFRVRHHYTPRLLISLVNDQTFSYAYSPDYQIFIVDNKGKLLLKIQKKEDSCSISQSEKKYIIKQLEESIFRSGRKWPEGVLEEACQFPSKRPFYWRITVDNLQRLFLCKIKSVLDKSRTREFDIFNKEGYFLYRAEIPVLPEIIHNGFLYNIKEDEETGGVFIRRFRIKNWEQIKERI